MCLQCERPGFDPWIGKIPWRRAWQPSPVFLLGESPRTEEPGCLQSMGLQRVGQDWATKHSTGMGPGVGPEGWLSWSVHPLGSALYRVYAQYPAFAPRTLLLLGVLVFLCLLFIICPKYPCTPVIFSPLEFLCILFAQVQALQQKVPGPR